MAESSSEYVRLALQQRQAFIAALPHAARHQARVLRTLLAANAQSAFGREHGFAEIDDLAAFRRAVPVRDYSGLSPWIERSANGELGVLTSERPLVFVTSSGSTGLPKRIPWTRRYVQEAFLPWFHAAVGNTLRLCPQAVERDDATMNLKWDPLHAVERTPGAAPAMGASQVDFVQRFGHQLAFEPGTRAPWALVPEAIGDELERIYFRVRWAIERDLAAIVGINPALVAALPSLIREWQERIMHELRAGTVLGAQRLPPNPRRAEELASVARYFGELRPAHIWPNLRIVYCWTGGAARLYIPSLAHEYGALVRFVPAPVAASEGVVAVPVDAHPTAGPLVVPCVFYEFVESDRDVLGAGPTLSFDELRVGHHYHVILSHVGGMYRYALGDIVRVVDHVCGVPRVEYAGRHQRHAVVGENLSVHHVVESLQRVLLEMGLLCRGAAWAVANTAPVGRRYQLALDMRDLDAELSLSLAAAIDGELQRREPLYASAQACGQLGPLELVQVTSGAFAREWAARVARGVRPAQVKDLVFVDDPSLWSELTGGARLA